MDWGTAAQWAGTATALTLGIWAAFSKKSDKALEGLERDVHGVQSDLRRLFERVDDVEGRVGKVEVTVQHLPTKDEVHAIDSKIMGLSARVETLIDRLNTLIHLYERAQDRLAEAEKK